MAFSLLFLPAPHSKCVENFHSQYVIAHNTPPPSPDTQGGCPQSAFANSRASLIANRLIPQTAGGWLYTTTGWIKEPWPPRWGRRSQPPVTASVNGETQEDHFMRGEQLVSEGRIHETPSCWEGCELIQFNSIVKWKLKLQLMFLCCFYHKKSTHINREFKLQLVLVEPERSSTKCRQLSVQVKISYLKDMEQKAEEQRHLIVWLFMF